MSLKSNCRFCGKQIMLVTGRKGHRVIVDPELVESFDQNSFLSCAVNAARVTAMGIPYVDTYYETKRGVIGTKGYVPHWISCSERAGKKA